MTQEKSTHLPATPPAKRRRWLWFVGLWLVGTLALLVFAYLLKGLMSVVGMTT